MKHFSKFGLWLAGIYAVFAGAIVYYSLTCSGQFCGFAILLPLMPWPFVMEAIPNSHMLFGFLDSIFGAFVFLFLNIVILYFIGALIGHVVNKIGRRNNVSSLN